MYLPGQIVYDLDRKRPVRIGSNVWDKRSYPKGRTTHFIRHTGKFTREHDFMTLAVPRTLKEARELLKKNLITPAPIPPSHCWRCQNWKSNCAALKTCSEWQASLSEKD